MKKRAKKEPIRNIPQERRDALRAVLMAHNFEPGRIDQMLRRLDMMAMCNLFNLYVSMALVLEYAAPPTLNRKDRK